MKAFVLILLLLSATDSLAQSIIQGRVLDGESKTPLPGASVFIANSTYGVASGTGGDFMIKGLPITHYKLVISFIGYQTQVLDIIPNASITYKILLMPSAKQLNQVVVHAKKRQSRAQWLANFRIFKERFIGLSENARFCSFENPAVLDFSNNGGILEAFADSTLTIDNTGLGYRIKIVLDKYRFNSINIQVHYEGQMVYEPLVPKDDEEKIRWARNRLKAYYGSEMHFLRSLYSRDLLNNGFYFNIVEKTYEDGKLLRRGIADTTMAPRSPIFNDRRIKVPTIANYYRILDSARSTPEEPVLSFKGELEIQYINEAEPGAYQQNRKIFPEKIQQRSTILLQKPCIIQPHGQVYPADAIETKNYWSWELMAESLPLNYDPNVDLAITGSQ